MKKYNKVLTIQMIAMYVIHIPFYIILIIARIPIIPFEIIKNLLIVGLCLNFVMIPILIASLVTGILRLVSDSDSPIGTTFKVKLGLIPWYLLNFLVCLLLVAGFLNPWLFLAVPILVTIEAMITYSYMISTSIPLVTYVIRGIITKKIEPTTRVIVGLVFSFFFVLDVVGCILLKLELDKKETKEFIGNVDK